jgi:hypothetical protein
LLRPVLAAEKAVHHPDRDAAAGRLLPATGKRPAGKFPQFPVSFQFQYLDLCPGPR